MYEDLYLSEAFNESPRVSSTHSRNIYDELLRISRHINFNHTLFINRRKRNNSISSVQAFIVELALTNESFCNYLKEFMVLGGEEWTPYAVRRFPKYSSPIDLAKAKKRQAEEVTSLNMYIDRDQRKFIDRRK